MNAAKLNKILEVAASRWKLGQSKKPESESHTLSVVKLVGKDVNIVPWTDFAAEGLKVLRIGKSVSKFSKRDSWATILPLFTLSLREHLQSFNYTTDSTFPWDEIYRKPRIINKVVSLKDGSELSIVIEDDSIDDGEWWLEASLGVDQ